MAPLHLGMRILIALLSVSVVLSQAACHKKSTGGGGSGAGGGSSSGGGSPPPPAPPPAPVPDAGTPYSLALAVVDEAGAPLPAAAVAVDGGSATPVMADGTLSISGLVGPVTLVATAPGYLDEPAVVDIADSAGIVTLRLWSVIGPGGVRRASVHFGGDVMLGRRYLAPTSDDTVTVTPGDGGASARLVVRGLAPLFRASSLGSVNVETVVGTLPDSDIYPGKLFILQSIPEIVSLLDELGIDLAVLGNNHIRDYLEPGIVATQSALDASGVPHVGAGVDEASAAVPVSLAASGLTFGFLSYSTIDGDSANDNFPLDADPEPSPIPPGDDFKYEFRDWGFTGPTVSVALAARRIGSAWVALQAAESGTSDPSEIAALWSSATAVYPELQDWVARRGHGGANRFTTARVTADVAALRAAGADIVVVQIHSGHHTYSPFQSIGMQTNSYASIDAGADLVVGHHPHIHQGIEYYKGKAVVYSIGNCAFDQDFIQTFTSGVLRVVFEESTLLETTLFPMTIHRYAPAPVTGGLGKAFTQLVHERSALNANTDVYPEGVRQVLDIPSGFAEPPAVLHLRNAMRVSRGAPTVTTQDVSAGWDAPLRLAGPRLVRSRAPGGAPLADVRLGRDVFQFGSFEDEAADLADRGGLHWRLPADEKGHKDIETLAGAPSGTRVLRLSRDSDDSSRTRVRPVARVNLVAHRLFLDVGGTTVPADGPASWTVRFLARQSAPAPTSLILDVYSYNATVANEEATSDLLRTVEISWSIPADDAWHDVLIEIPASALDPVGALEANQAMMYLALYPPPAGTSVLRMDDVRFLEWRAATDLPDGFFAVDEIRSGTPGTTVSVTLERLGE